MKRRKRDHVSAVVEAAKKRGLDLTQFRDRMEWERSCRQARAREKVKREQRRHQREHQGLREAA